MKTGFGTKGGVVRPEMTSSCPLDRVTVPTVHVNEGFTERTGWIDPHGPLQHPQVLKTVLHTLRKRDKKVQPV
jgi:hypothetical protein